MWTNVGRQLSTVESCLDKLRFTRPRLLDVDVSDAKTHGLKGILVSIEARRKEGITSMTLDLPTCPGLRKMILMITALFLLLTGTVSAGGYVMKKEVGGYDVVMEIDRNPPIASENNVTIEVTDTKTRCACQATVVIEYSRPAMPGAPALKYTAQTELRRGRHRAKIILSMPGSWNLAVKIITEEKTWTTNFTVDVN